jgi:hypothetical protein
MPAVTAAFFVGFLASLFIQHEPPVKLKALQSVL